MNEIMLGSFVFVGFVLLLAVMVVTARAYLLPAQDVVISVNGSMRITAKSGATLNDILSAASVGVPAACGGKGTCGQCRVKLNAGAGKALPTEAAKLTRRELGAGLRLSCQIIVRNDLQVDVSDDILGAESWSSSVISSRTLSPLIREIVLDLPQGKAIDFRAGAFAQVTAPPHLLSYDDFDIAPEHREMWDRFGLKGMKSTSAVPVVRAYSIANRPEDRDRLVLLIRLALPPAAVKGAPPGIVSSYLFGLKPGDTVDVAAPYGEFSAQETDREMVFIGGGVGMAPLRSIIFDELQRRGTSRKLSFWYGARSRIDLFYEEEFEMLERSHANFTWTPALSEPEPGDEWDGATGFVHQVVHDRLLKDHPAPEECEYYLCGPPLMIRAVLAMLDDIGVDPESIFFDDFGE